jgi:signal transduction histidine kinase
MSWFVPKTLAGRLIALLLLALLISQALAFLIFARERRDVAEDLAHQHVYRRTVAVIRLINETSPSIHRRIIRNSNTPQIRFWITGRPPTIPNVRVISNTGPSRWIKSRLAGQVGDVFVQIIPRRMNAQLEITERRQGRTEGERSRPPWSPRIIVSAALPDGRWLNSAAGSPAPYRVIAWPRLLTLALMAAAIALAAILAVRHITQPLNQLASAADRFGRGDHATLLPETGPAEIIKTTRAFNQMQDRLMRFVQDRTRMLAAVSHDLRTPITTLRLRAEFIEDEETQQKVIATLDEMQRMTDATLAFAQDDSAQEQTKSVDLAALVGSICEDMTDLGNDVAWADHDRFLFDCRPTALRRVVRNLIENAVKYGERARVAMTVSGEAIVIAIDDDGPGIPDDAHETVFSPFYRLEESRNKDTGGIGLGLAIARSIARNHGGDITLKNRQGGGLTATIQLPLGV